jgi:hypothetical protein
METLLHLLHAAAGKQRRQQQGQPQGGKSSVALRVRALYPFSVDVRREIFW